MVPDHADQARGLIVTAVALRAFRSYEREDLGLAAGLTVVVGQNGAGKTSLLEAVHLATQGFSPRTRRDARCVRLGAPAARVVADGTRDSGTPFRTEVTLEAAGGKRLVLDGAQVSTPDELRRHFPVLAFTPDRLAVVKGGPLVRRTYLDRTLSRLYPARTQLPSAYARAVAQRNAALRRAAVGDVPPDAIAPWTKSVAQLGSELDRARSDAIAAVRPGFTAVAAALGLEPVTLRYDARELTVAELDERLERDLDRGTTGLGPHLRDVWIGTAERELRALGSQGEQRIAVLALLLGEAQALAAALAAAPLLLLDDVLSELDDARRQALLEVLPAGCQTLVTATTLRSLPPGTAPPALVLEVENGRARPR